MSIPELLERLDSLAAELASAQVQTMYRGIAEATELVGNVVNAKGAAFSAELVLDTMRKIEIDFDSDGSPRLPTIHINPAQSRQVQKVIEEASQDDALKAEYDRILEAKKREWDAREADRRLVG